MKNSPPKVKQEAKVQIETAPGSGQFKDYPGPGQPSALETLVATILCQYGRVTRNMPSEAELQRALPMARSIIAAVHGERKV